MTLFKRLTNKQRKIWHWRWSERQQTPPQLNALEKLKPLEYAMRLVLLGLIVCAVMAQFGCSTTPYALPTVPRMPPQACLSKCPDLPLLADGKDLTVRLWEFDVIEFYGQCKRDHETCVKWVTE